MYELERKPDDFQELTNAQATSAQAVVSDMTAPFELWLNSVQAETPTIQKGASAVALESPLFIQALQRVETPPPSVTHKENASAFELCFKGTLQVDGYFTGKVRSDEGTLVLAEGGEINTDIAVGIAQISGTVVGNIQACQRIELDSTARVIGDLYTRALTVKPGALFEGKCYFQDAPGNGNHGGKNSRAQRIRRVAEHDDADTDSVRVRPLKPSGRKPQSSRRPDWRRS